MGELTLVIFAIMIIVTATTYVQTGSKHLALTVLFWSPAVILIVLIAFLVSAHQSTGGAVAGLVLTTIFSLTTTLILFSKSQEAKKMKEVEQELPEYPMDQLPESVATREGTVIPIPTMFDDTQIRQDLSSLRTDEAALLMYLKGISSRWSANLLRKNRERLLQLVKQETELFHSMVEDAKAIQRLIDLRSQLDLQKAQSRIEAKELRLKEIEIDKRIEELTQERKEESLEEKWEKSQKEYQLEIQGKLRTHIVERQVLFREIRRLRHEENTEINRILKGRSRHELSPQEEKEIKEIEEHYENLIREIKAGKIWQRE